MDLEGCRCLIAGATGEMGGALARAMHREGASLALMGRREDRLAALGRDLGAPVAPFDLAVPAEARGAVEALAGALGGFDAVVVACGRAAFGPAGSLTADLVSEVFAVNALGPIEVIEAALPRVDPRGAVAGVSAIVAEHPMAGLAHYSAAKAALSAYLRALRHERRRDGPRVLDVRPPHLDTGFSARALAGTPPPLPEPVPLDDLVGALLELLRDGRRDLSWDLRERRLVTR
jgi:NAD(P)-dependent dehydrogenase (short-subunit alcohol dehydrogenase family)